MDIHVIGGCYREICHWPNVDEVHGSGGRAAEVIAQLSQKKGTHLHSVLETTLQDKLRSNFALLACDFQLITSNKTPIFEYLHPLSVPDIHPCRSDLAQAQKHQIQLSVDNALVFGMLEADIEITARKVVYDPQDSVSPQLFRSHLRQAESLALVLNKAEALSFYELLKNSPPPNNISVENLAQILMSEQQADVVVIKNSQRGAFVTSNNTDGQWVAAYKTNNVYPIGSGDCFAAAFTYYWIEQNMSAAESAKYASAVTAFYCDNRTYPDVLNVKNLFNEYQALSTSEHQNKNVYLAGPFFNLKEMWMINQSRQALKNAGLSVFSPYHNVGVGSAEEVVKKDIEAIHNCDILYALFDDQDPGTLFEIGYAVKSGKQVIIYAETATAEQLKMYEGMGCQIYSDFSTSIYQTCWSLD